MDRALQIVIAVLGVLAFASLGFSYDPSVVRPEPAVAPEASVMYLLVAARIAYGMAAWRQRLRKHLTRRHRLSYAQGY